MGQLAMILESEEYGNFVENNGDLLNEINEVVADFKEIMKTFVAEHADQFIAESMEETYKNIRVFSEVAMAQFMTEVTNIYSSVYETVEEKTERTFNDYF